MTDAARPAVDRLAWPHHRLGELLAELLRHAGLSRPGLSRPGLGGGEQRLPAPPDTLPPAAAGTWIERAARVAGVEAESVTFEYRRLADSLVRAAPAVLRLPPDGGEADGPARYLALVGGRRGRVRVLTPELTVAALPAEVLSAHLRRPAEAGVGAAADRLLERSGAAGRRRRRARRALLERSLGSVPIGGCWLLRPPPGSPFLRQLRRAGAGWRMALLVASHVVQYGLLLGSWYLIGRGALAGAIDGGRLVAWALLLATLVPVSLLTYHLHGRLVIDLGVLLKRRLLAGALELPLDRIRAQGSGELLGRVIEAETFEALILAGGFQALTAALEVVMVTPVLWAGAGGALHAALFAVWVAVTAWAGWRYHRHLGRWTRDRLDQTLELVERMVGYRTRIAQQDPERWHDGEDDALVSYHDRSRPMDGSAALLSAGAPRAWMLVGTLAIAPAFLGGTATLAPLAVAFGGNLLAFGALAKLTFGLAALAAAQVAWRQIEPLFKAAGEVGEVGDPAVLLAAEPRQAGPRQAGPRQAGPRQAGPRQAGPRQAGPRQAAANGGEPDGAGDLLTAENLTFRYHGGGPAAVLRGASLSLRRGDRALLEGRSGAGKSTLISLLTGLRDPDAGLLLLGGVDRPTLGDELWRGRLAAAPQFHENHVLLGTFAYNLLMGRRWPPTAGDLREAETLCRELGLGELVERMPGGLQQMVGETGWQLSHGERSRLFLARALLQDAELVILDESFAALDPESLRKVLAATFERAPTLLVVAHP